MSNLGGGISFDFDVESLETQPHKENDLAPLSETWSSLSRIYPCFVNRDQSKLSTSSPHCEWRNLLECQQNFEKEID